MMDVSKIIIPHQDIVWIETDINDESVDISQEDNSGNRSERVVTIYGVSNIDRLIAALQDARRQIGGAA